MASIQTVLGPIAPSDLGPTLAHEHVITGWPGWEMETDYTFDREAVTAMCVEKMRRVREAGCGGWIDLTPVTLGRDASVLIAVSQGSGVPIIAATGLYKELAIPHHIAMFWDVDRLAEMFVRDITVGLDGTTAKAGIIKVATSLGQIPAAEEKVCRAAGRASKRTGTPISTHTDGGTMGPEQLRFFLAEGADPAKILIGHSDGNLRLDYHRSILRQGAGVSLDRVSGQAVISDSTRAQVIAQLVNEGFGKQIVISHDAQLHWLGRPGMNERDHTYIFREFVPMLRAAGLSEGAVQDILVENPRRYLTN